MRHSPAPAPAPLQHMVFQGHLWQTVKHSSLVLNLSYTRICHIKSSPYHPVSNGLAERAVQCYKKCIKKSSNADSLETRIARFLSPHSTTGTPAAELLLGRIPHRLAKARALYQGATETLKKYRREIKKFMPSGEFSLLVIVCLWRSFHLERTGWQDQCLRWRILYRTVWCYYMEELFIAMLTTSICPCTSGVTDSLTDGDM